MTGTTIDANFVTGNTGDPLHLGNSGFSLSIVSEGVSPSGGTTLVQGASDLLGPVDTPPPPVDPDQYAPNGFGGPQPNVVFIDTLPQDAKNAIDDVFAVTYTDADGEEQTFDATGVFGPDAFNIADFDVTFPGSSEVGVSGLDNNAGTVYQWVSPTNIGAVADQMGVSDDEAFDVVAAQEWTHSMVRAHPELRGKLTLQESEVLGEAASLAVNDAYAFVSLGNAFQPDPSYAGIRDTVVSTIDGLGADFDIPGGREFLTDLGQWARAEGLRGTGDFDAETIGRFVEETYEVSPEDFLPAFRTAMADGFETAARDVLEERLPMEDR